MLQLLGLLDYFFDVSYHVKSLFRQVIILTINNGAVKIINPITGYFVVDPLLQSVSFANPAQPDTFEELATRNAGRVYEQMEFE